MDPETVPDARAEDDDLLSLHVVDDPSKVRELPVLYSVAEDAKQELDLRPPVGPLHSVVVSESNKLADSIGLVAREQSGCHRDCDRA